MEEVVTKGAYGHVTHGIFLYTETCTPHPQKKKMKGNGVFIYRILYVCQSRLTLN